MGPVDRRFGPTWRLLETMIAEVGRLEGAVAPRVINVEGSLRCPRVHRRARPRRPHASGGPDSLAGVAPGSDDLSDRPRWQLFRPGLHGDTRLHEALHGRV